MGYCLHFSYGQDVEKFCDTLGELYSNISKVYPSSLLPHLLPFLSPPSPSPTLPHPPPILSPPLPSPILSPPPFSLLPHLLPSSLLPHPPSSSHFHLSVICSFSLTSFAADSGHLSLCTQTDWEHRSTGVWCSVFVRCALSQKLIQSL